MPTIAQCPVAEDSLLRTYRGGKHPERWGHYGDCFSVSVDPAVTLGEFVLAFYTSPVFQVERWILQIVAGAASTDGEARALADGRGESFAVWTVGARTVDQLLMCDRYGKTRSWFRVAPLAAGGTVLQFGSAVAGRPQSDGAWGMSRSFGVLLGFHRLYSRVLLAAAVKRRG
jgi:hypothetical protein